MSSFSRKHPTAYALIVIAVASGVVYAYGYGIYRLGSLLTGGFDVLVWIGGLASALGLGAFVGLRNRRKNLEVARQPRVELEGLTEWAAENDWTIQHLGHPTLTDEIERIEFLTDNAGWGHGTTGGQRHSGTNDWAFGGAVQKQTGSGRLIIIAGFRYEDRRLWAALKTTATAPRVTWDLVEEGKVEQSGALPPLEEGEPVANLFTGLAPITRLRIIDDEIILCQPGRFEPELLTATAERLTALERRLPRPPGAGPQR